MFVSGMTRGLVCLLLAAVLMPAAMAHSHKRRNLEVVHPWTPEMVAKEVATARVFMTIRNGGKVADRLLSASTPRAEKVELAAGEHGTAGNGGANLPFSIAPGKELVLGAKGHHLVLSGVKQPFRAYDDFKLTLVFEKAGRMVVDVMVEEAEHDHAH
jgi:copper(I)-binding protein